MTPADLKKSTILIVFILAEREPPRRVDYHLSQNFNRPENLYLRNATHEAVKRVNDALKQADAHLQLNLVHTEQGEQEKASGDLRYNTIILIDEPLSNGLLGYGPSVSNPHTGEILQAHTNMYSGVLKSTVRRTYLAMMRLSQENSVEKAESNEEANEEAVKFALSALSPQQTPLAPVTTPIKISVTQRINPQAKEKIKAVRRGINHHDLHQHGEEKHSPSMDFQSFIEIHSKNNAYHVEMVNFSSLGKRLFPGICRN